MLLIKFFNLYKCNYTHTDDYTFLKSYILNTYLHISNMGSDPKVRNYTLH